MGGSTSSFSCLTSLRHQHGYGARIYVVDHLTEAVFSTEDGLILEASDSCLQLFGCPAEQLKGKQFSDLLDFFSNDVTGAPWTTKCITSDGSALDVVVTAFQVQGSKVVRYHVSNAEKKRFTLGSSSGDDTTEGGSSFDESSAGGSDLGNGGQGRGSGTETSLGLYTMVRMRARVFLMRAAIT